MRQTFIFYIIIFFISPIFGQYGFNIKYDFNEPLAIFLQCAWVGGDTLALYGIGYSNEGNLNQQGLLFARADTNGGVIDYHIYYDINGEDYATDLPSAFIKLKNGDGYLLLARLIQPGNKDVVIVLNNTGEIQDQLIFSDSISRSRGFQRVVETSDSYYFSGIRQKLNYQIGVVIMRTDKIGNIMWEKYYDTPNRDDSVDSFFKINENEIVVGASSTSLPSVNPVLAKSSPKIFAVDSLGNVKWSWEGPFAREEVRVTGLHRSADNYWYYNTLRAEYRISEMAYYRQPKFVKRDSNFNLVWSRPVGEFQSFFNGFNYSFPTQNGEWMAVGNTLSGPKTLSGWMYRMSTDGDSLWSRLDTAQASGAIACENYLYGAVELPSGSIIACGYSDRLDDVKPWGWLIKVDQNGCMDTLDCKMSGNAVVHDLGRPGPQVYPNPVSSVLYFEDGGGSGWERIDICNTLAQTVLTVRQPAGHQLDVSALPAGLYWVRFYEAGRSWVQPVVKN